MQDRARRAVSLANKNHSRILFTCKICQKSVYGPFLRRTTENVANYDEKEKQNNLCLVVLIKLPACHVIWCPTYFLYHIELVDQDCLTITPSKLYDVPLAVSTW